MEWIVICFLLYQQCLRKSFIKRMGSQDGLLLQLLYQYLSQYFSSSCRDSTWMDLQELSKANLVLFRPLLFCAAAFGFILGVANFRVVANLALSGCVVPVWQHSAKFVATLWKM